MKLNHKISLALGAFGAVEFDAFDFHVMAIFFGIVFLGRRRELIWCP
jgi:hypothetical protein